MSKKAGQVPRHTGSIVQKKQPQAAATSKPVQSWNGWTTVWVSFGVFLVACLLYAGSLEYPFVYDDYHTVVQAEHTQSLDAFFKHVGFGNRRYLTTLSYVASTQFGALKPSVHRIVSILGHGLCAALIAYLIGAWLRLFHGLSDRKQNQYFVLFGGLFGALFAIHPAQTQAVVYIAQRATVFAGLTYVLVLSLHASSFQCRGHSDFTPAHWRYWAALALAFLGMFTKEIFITAPLALIVADFFLAGQKLRPWMESRAKVLWPFLISLVVLPILVLVFSESEKAEVFAVTSGESRNLSPLAYFQEQIRSYELYARLVILPIGQRIVYGSETTPVWASWQFYAGLALVTLVFFGIIRTSKSKPMSALGLALLVLTVLVEFTFIPIKDLIQEHRLYLPLLGICVWLASQLADQRRPLIWTSATAVFATFFFMGSARLEMWRSTEVLWRDNVEKEPGLVIPLLGLGQALSERGDNRGAIETYKKAAAIDPSSDVALANVGILYFLEKRPADSALAWLRRGLFAKLSGTDSLKLSIFLAGGPSDTLSGPDIARAMEYSLAKRKALEGYGLVLHNLKRFKEAAHVLEAQAHVRSEDPTLWNNVAAAYLSLGQKRMGLRFLDSAIKYGYPLRMDSYQKVKQAVDSGAP